MYSNTNEWHALLHYNHGVNTVADKNYFVSNKPYNPEDEFDTLLSLLNTSQRDEAICKYPDRYLYISKQMNISISFKHCQELNYFVDEVDGETVSIVYASSYVNSPISYFGHTFLIINKKDNPLFSYTVSFAASIDNTKSTFSTLSDAVSGQLTGLYMVKPYFRLIREYSDIEQRALISYELDLSKDEILKLIYHMYTLRNINFEYGFFKENCADAMLWMLDNARYTNIQQEATLYLIPLESMKLIENKYAVSKKTKIPSMIDKLSTKYDTLNGNEKKIFNEIKGSNDSLQNFHDLNNTDISKENISYMLNGYNELEFLKFNKNPTNYLDIQRIPRLDEDLEVDFNSTLDYQSTKIVYSMQQEKEKPLKSILTISPILFNRLYDKSSDAGEYTLEFLSVSCSYDGVNLSRLESIDIVNIQSYTKRKDFYAPYSWEFYIGGNRQLNNNSLNANISYGSGLSYEIYNSLVYFLIDIDCNPFISNIGMYTKGGISYWYKNNLHTDFLYKIPLIYNHLICKQEYSLNMIYDVSKFINIGLKIEHIKDEQNRNNVLSSVVLKF